MVSKREGLSIFSLPEGVFDGVMVVGGLPSEKGTKPFLFRMRSGSEYHLSGMKSSGRTKHSPAERKLVMSQR